MRKKEKPTKKTKRQPHTSRFSLRTKFLLTTGLLLLAIPFFYSINQSIQLRYIVPEVPEVKTPTTTAAPISISIPAVSLSLPVEQTEIINNTWEISDHAVSHLAVSANPTESGPIIMYDHNTKSRFGPIRWIEPGDIITINTADNKRHSYTVTETKVVHPDELSIFFERKSEMLYLYTCDGFADLMRFIVIAEPHNSSVAD